jgi:hypothetical protein
MVADGGVLSPRIGLERNRLGIWNDGGGSLTDSGLVEVLGSVLLMSCDISSLSNGETLKGRSGDRVSR